MKLTLGLSCIVTKEEEDIGIIRIAFTGYIG